jgi:hypothetical protein
LWDGPEAHEDDTGRGDPVTRSYLVIGVFEDDYRRFAREYVVEGPQEAEDAAVADNPGLIVAGVINEEGQVVQ